MAATDPVSKRTDDSAPVSAPMPVPVRVAMLPEQETSGRVRVGQATPVRRAAMMFGGLLGGLLVASAVVGRGVMEVWEPGRWAGWQHLGRHPVAQQLTGFAVLALVALVLVLPVLRSRGVDARRLWFWRTLHVLIGGLAVLGLMAHTGLRLGENLNRWTMLSFLLLCGVGALSAMVMGTIRARRWLRPVRRLHIVLFWPALALLGLHVVASYYF